MPRSRRVPAASLACGLLLLLGACNRTDPAELRQAIGESVQDNLLGVKATQDDIENTQEELLAKLAALSDQHSELLIKMDSLAEALAQAERPPSRPERPPRPGKPNPAATYKVTLGDAQTKGPLTAKVTVVEWSDFQ